MRHIGLVRRDQKVHLAELLVAQSFMTVKALESNKVYLKNTHFFVREDLTLQEHEHKR